MSMTEFAGRRVLVTGGTGFIGSAVVRGLLAQGARVRVLDNQSRGAARRLQGLDVDLVEGDIRDAQTVAHAVQGTDLVCHLAAVNGTELFYSKPDVVLEVAIKGMVNVMDACIAHGVRQLAVTSSSEVYQRAPMVPTPEDVPLVVPDLSNPRYSYGGGKIATELLAYHCGPGRFDHVAIVRPHNVYGPDMGREHVIPQLTLRLLDMPAAIDGAPQPFAIQGTGEETRAFVYIDDFVDGFLRVVALGTGRTVYNVGTDVEVAIRDVVALVADALGRRITIAPGPLQAGSTARRCPDISRVRALGFTPRVSLPEGIAATVAWYRNHHRDTLGDHS